MNAKNYWQMFLETGAPEFYLLYNDARKMENEYVLDSSGIGASCHTVQRS